MTPGRHFPASQAEAGSVTVGRMTIPHLLPSLLISLVGVLHLVSDPVRLGASEPARPRAEAFLFSFFRDHGQDGLFLAWSPDGLKWTELKPPGRSFLQPKLGDKLRRDPGRRGGLRLFRSLRPAAVLRRGEDPGLQDLGGRHETALAAPGRETRHGTARAGDGDRAAPVTVDRDATGAADPTIEPGGRVGGWPPGALATSPLTLERRTSRPRPQP